MENLSVKAVVISLIKSIDLVNYLLKDHHRRVAIIAYNVGVAMDLSPERLRRLVLAASLHDVGALYVAERDELIQLDTIDTIEHSARGAYLLKEFDSLEPISLIILHHHRHWGLGHGANFEGVAVPIESFILHLADRIEILLNKDEFYQHQSDQIVSKILKRKNTVFHPECVEGFIKISGQESFWLSIIDSSFENLLNKVIDSEDLIKTDYAMLETVSKIFSKIVDYRSHFTATHSFGVGYVAYEIGKLCSCDEKTCQKLKIAGLLHDIGKIGIPTELIEKTGQLTDDEKKIMKSHAYYTNIILSNLRGMEDICEWASMHHEKRDGSGYPFHYRQDKFYLEIDILIIADIFTALSEQRPYRDGYTMAEVKEILIKEYSIVDKDLMEKVIGNLEMLDFLRYNAQKESMTAYLNSMQSVNHLIQLKEINSYY